MFRTPLLALALLTACDSEIDHKPSAEVGPAAAPAAPVAAPAPAAAPPLSLRAPWPWVRAATSTLWAPRSPRTTRAASRC